MAEITTLVHWVYQYPTGGPKACSPAIATQIDPPQPGDTGERLWLTVFHPYGMTAESVPLGTPPRRPRIEDFASAADEALPGVVKEETSHDA